MYYKNNNRAGTRKNTVNITTVKLSPLAHPSLLLSLLDNFDNTLIQMAGNLFVILFVCLELEYYIFH